MAYFIASNLFTLAVFISTSNSESTSMQNSMSSLFIRFRFAPCSAHRGWRARIEEHERRLPVGCGCSCLGGQSCVSYHDNCHERGGEEHDIYSRGWSVRKRNSNLGISILKSPRTRYRE
ncbi:hypothetical protein V6N11_010837 [Hibiscus sabdariffa]|uniref:Secreted protein n=1 Tax=Hibiscus sabdariffa TaxID=183260 RepID=A0ABR2S6V2_9ROSI